MVLIMIMVKGYEDEYMACDEVHVKESLERVNFLVQCLFLFPRQETHTHRHTIFRYEFKIIEKISSMIIDS